jgi:hypothetical protein
MMAIASGAFQMNTLLFDFFFAVPPKNKNVNK